MSIRLVALGIALSWVPSARAELDSFGLGDGHDGALSVAAPGTVVNVYAGLADDVAAGATSVDLTDAAGFAAGDLLLLWQPIGYPVPTSGDATPIDLTGDLVGRWEFARVTAVAGDSLTLRGPMREAFPAGSSQAIRVPEYTTVTVAAGASVAAEPWDGVAGGILVFLVQGAVQLDGALDVSATGSRGGIFDMVGTGDNGCTDLDEPAPHGAMKGEGIAAAAYPAATGRGNVANGGGGGICHNSGGGGGGHGGAGGIGGRNWRADPDTTLPAGVIGGRPVGGLGGAAVRHSLLDRLIPGGGGGTGQGNNAVGTDGGNGGGVVFFRAAALLGAGRVSANGADVATSGIDASGGGGAGGSILIRVVGEASCLTLEARGGQGGDSGDYHGPGGGGAGGLILLQAASGTCAADVPAGLCGTQPIPDAADGPTYGASAGEVGSEETPPAGGYDDDADHDGLPDIVEDSPDHDGDTVPDFLDPDDDGDGILTRDERPGDVDRDTDGDTTPDHLDPDDDGDTVPTRDERPGDADQDTDGDGRPNHLDPDDDDDGILTIVERGDVTDLGGDPDDDDVPAYLDLDSDGDGLLDEDEGTGDGDDDGIPDYLDPWDGPASTPGLAGGALCGCRAPGSEGTGGGLLVLGLLALCLGVSRRGAETRRGKGRKRPVGYPLDRSGSEGCAGREQATGDRRPATGDDHCRLPVACGRLPVAAVRLKPRCGPAPRSGRNDDSAVVPGRSHLDPAGRSGQMDTPKRPFERGGGGTWGGAAAGLLATALLAWPAAARGQSVTLDQYRSAETGEDGFALSRPDDLGHLRWGVRLDFDYAWNPLVLERTQGDAGTEAGAVVEHQLVAQLTGALGLIDRLVLFVGLPIDLVMTGDEFRGVPAADGTSVGDLFLGLRVRILGERGDLFGLGAQAAVYAPTGEAAQEGQSFSGEGTFAGWLKIMAELRWEFLRVTANLGARLREPADFGSLGVGHEFTWGLGVTVPAVRDVLDVFVESYGATTFETFGDREGSPVELIAGLKAVAVPGLNVGLAGGLGLQRGYGSPDARAILTFAWTTPPESKPEPTPEPGDRDGDGLLDDDDDCPDDPEDEDGFEDEDGCPDPDNDGDGILDDDDGCRDVAEDEDGFEDEDGCPDPDNDGDGILDGDDGCRDVAEDDDDFEDEDGCPEPDNDGDTVLDADDDCPLEPGLPEADGCPRNIVVDRDLGQIRLTERIEFETDSDVLLERSTPVLEEVRNAMRSNVSLRLVRAEGHTDDRSTDAHNLDLSQRRAQTVVTWLIQHGIAADRLEAWGCGESAPVESNRTPAGRQTNRRVEFHILDPMPPGTTPRPATCRRAE